MGMPRSPNAAHRQAHEHPLARKLAAVSPLRRGGRLQAALKRLSFCIAVAGLAVFAAAPAALAHAITMTKPEKQLLKLVNHVRAKHHLHQLTMVRSLERASRAHSRQMVHNGYFDHNSTGGESVGARLIRFGYTATGCTRWTVGENIAYGRKSSGTPHAVFMAWWHSPAHRHVMLTKRFRNLGIGRASGTFKGVSGVIFYTLDCGARTR